MTIRIQPDVASALNAEAERKGVSPEDLALDILRERFGAAPAAIVAADAWERSVLSIGSAAARSASDDDLSRERLYD